MQKYVIKGTIKNSLLYYAGKHYEMTSAFSASINQATLYSDPGDAHNMLNVLEVRFETTFQIVPVKVTIVEMTSK